MTPTGDMGFALMKIMAMLAVVLAVLVVLFYLIRRLSNPLGNRGRQGLISVLTTHYLSPKEKLVLVNLADKTLLLGVTPQGINTLHVLDQPLDGPANEAAGSSIFGQLLKGKLAAQAEEGESKKDV